MALSSAQVWEVRAAASDLNGGAFKAGASGTDYSQQDGPQVTFTDLAITAAPSQVTSSASPFTSAHVGNVLNVSGGAGFTTGRYEITSVASGVATLDRSAGTASSVGGSARLGGAVATFAALASSMVPGNKAWVRSGTYSLTSTLTLTQGGGTTAYNVPPSQILGYASSRGDITETSANQSSRPVLAVAAALGGAAITLTTAGGWHLRNLQVSLSSGSFTVGISSSQAAVLVHNCKVAGHSTIGINLVGTAGVASFCEVTAGAVIATSGITLGSSATAERCYVHDTVGVGISHGSTGDVTLCLVESLTGASSDGIQVTAQGRALHNVVHGAARHGINLTAPNWVNRVRGNILSSNGGYGLTSTAGAGLASLPEADGNAFHNNTSGARNAANLDDTTANPVSGSAPYSNAYDLFLTASPFVNAGSKDFRLNSNAGGGADCRAAAPMNSLPGLSAAAGYRDMGAIQHQDFGITNVTFLEG